MKRLASFRKYSVIIDRYLFDYSSQNLFWQIQKAILMKKKELLRSIFGSVLQLLYKLNINLVDEKRKDNQ